MLRPPKPRRPPVAYRFGRHAVRPDAVAAILTANWSFSVICCDTSDDRAVAQANAAARDLGRRGHMAVLLAAGALVFRRSLPAVLKEI